MNQNRVEGQRWLAQAQYDLRAADLTQRVERLTAARP